ncbi:DUF3267 domain-containing protein [Clostridium sp.]|uniref:DUF3267 domain-containing protein n=1 Tax=Clostridium sp. TaxID=1506 RepID=UPI0032168308
MYRELTTDWKPIDIKYSKIKMIILFFILYYFTEYCIKSIGVNFNEVSILKRLIVAIGTLILHEGTHFFIGVSLGKNRGKVHIGFIPKKMTFYANIDGTYNFFTLILYTISPFCIITILLGIVMYKYSILQPILWIIVFYNSFLSVLDIYNSTYIIKNYSLSDKFKLSEFVLYYSK